jgi:hypothetical protein
MSCAVVNDVQTGKRFKLHQEQGAERGAGMHQRMDDSAAFSELELEQWHGDLPQHSCCCVKLPSDMAQYYKVTKDFSGTDSSVVSQPGAMTT